MATFLLVLDRWAVNDDSLEARFTQGPAEAPVVYVDAEGLEDPTAVETYLAGIEPFNEEIEIVESAGAVTIQSEYAEPLAVRGNRVSLRTSPFEATDFERIAKINEERGKSEHDAWRKLNSRVSDVRHLLHDQRRRLLEKAARHKSDSTARQLYEQQLSFIDRVLAKLDT